MMPNISDPENEFEKRGVTFKIITDDMGPQVIIQIIYLSSVNVNICIIIEGVCIFVGELLPR